eukprot:1193642-Prorocentrum_minimum.AAC.2
MAGGGGRYRDCCAPGGGADPGAARGDCGGAERPAGGDAEGAEFGPGEFARLRGEFARLRGEFARLRGEFAHLRGEFARPRGVNLRARGVSLDQTKDSTLSVPIILDNRREVCAYGGTVIGRWARHMPIEGLRLEHVCYCLSGARGRAGGGGQDLPGGSGACDADARGEAGGAADGTGGGDRRGGGGQSAAAGRAGGAQAAPRHRAGNDLSDFDDPGRKT